jgi:RNA-directed DNA polymerase
MKGVIISMTSVGNASDNQLRLNLEIGDETRRGHREEDAPVTNDPLMERVLERYNLVCALRRVTSNKGGGGIDGMSVEQLPAYLKQHWPTIKTALLKGTYRPQPVKRVEIPKLGGGVRLLGIPTVLDRLIQQALLQALQPEWDRSFSDSSFGFRPNRSAHQAIRQAREYIKQGSSWVVDLDLEKFFDNVNHDKLMQRVKQRIEDKRVLKLINDYLKSGVMIGTRVEPTLEGTPQGGPLSPLLGNLLLDDFDKELERRGHSFVRYADDSNIYVKSQRAGVRVLDSVTRFLKRKLKLTVNQSKSAVDRPWKRTFVGFTILSGRYGYRIKVSTRAIIRLKQTIKRLSRRTRGRRLQQVIGELREYLLGWKAYFRINEVKSALRDLDKWIRRRLRSYAWKQWGRSGYRKLRQRGVSVKLAWNTAKSAHGPWRLSHSPALSFAMPASYFAGMGLPKLVDQ